jgi:hypothetical protein
MFNVDQILKAGRHLRSTGVADVSYFGPEAEFYVFDHVAFDQQANTAFYEVDSEEGHWTSGQGFQRRGAGHYLVIDGERTAVDYSYMHLREAALVCGCGLMAAHAVERSRLPLPLMLILRGFACSATGIVIVSTPLGVTVASSG